MTEFSSEDIKYMSLAIELAKKGIYSTKPNPAVGSVIVRHGEIVGQGWHQKAGQPHAERIALAEAGDKAKGATAYVTLETCSHHGKTPPCADALVAAQVARVVISMVDPNPLVAGQGIARLENAGIEVVNGLLEDQARELNVGFLYKMENNLPYVRLKMASSLDGRTAMQSGESKWITGPESRLEVHRLRAQSGALIAGIGTILADDPSMTVRMSDEQLAELNLTQEDCHPIRVILDPNLSMPLDAKMLSLPGRTILMTSRETVERNPEVVEEIHNAGIEMAAVSAEGDRLDIESVLSYLAEVEKINNVMVETGAIVAGAFIQAGFVNELHCFMAPTLMGEQAKPMFALPGVETMQDRIHFDLKSIDRFGEDVRMVFTPKTN